VLQDLQTVASDLATIASASGASPAGGPHSSAPGRPSPWNSDSPNNGTPNGNIPDAGNGPARPNGWQPGYLDRFQQQFAASAYSASSSGLDSSTNSSLSNITV
jgi:hypothetical protein